MYGDILVAHSKLTLDDHSSLKSESRGGCLLPLLLLVTNPCVNSGFGRHKDGYTYLLFGTGIVRYREGK